MSKYDPDRKGYELKDGNLIRVDGDEDNVKISLYDGDERDKGEHERTTINYNTKTGKGSIDYHNDDKTEKESTKIGCYLTSACMHHYSNAFDDNCYELNVLRCFRDKFVPKEDIDHYYITAPIIVESINNTPDCDTVYDYIYNNVIEACVKAIERDDYNFAYDTYKNSILSLEETFARPTLQQGLVKVLKRKSAIC